jgi:hypothetical protein
MKKVSIEEFQLIEIKLQKLITYMYELETSVKLSHITATKFSQAEVKEEESSSGTNSGSKKKKSKAGKKKTNLKKRKLVKEEDGSDYEVKEEEKEDIEDQGVPLFKDDKTTGSILDSMSVLKSKIK